MPAHPMSHAMMVKKCMEMNPGMTLPQASKKVAADRRRGSAEAARKMMMKKMKK